MVKNQPNNNNNSTLNNNLTCIENRETINNVHLNGNDKNQGLFDWDEFTRGQVLGAFYIGYITTQVSILDTNRYRHFCNF